MFIFTTTALKTMEKTDSLPEWPGRQVLVVLPGGGVTAQQIEAAPDRLVVEWLEPPKDTVALLSDVLNWLRHSRLEHGEGPLLYLDAPLAQENTPLPHEDIAHYDVRSKLDPAGHLSWLILGEMIATSPLLPEFLRNIEGRNLDNAAVVGLLADILAWGK
ncbi:MAG: hypothetical protein ACK5MY_13900 [Jhaorihella sp.]